MALIMIRDCRDWMHDMASSIHPSRLLGFIDNNLHHSHVIQRQSPIIHKDGFKVNLDVQQFSPEEIQVKVVDNCVEVEGKHEEKEDEHGYISRHFVRRYVVPKEYKVDASVSSVSSDGVLTISAPKIEEAIEAIEDSRERGIPITQTGPHKAVDCKEENKK